MIVPEVTGKPGDNLEVTDAWSHLLHNRRAWGEGRRGGHEGVEAIEVEMGELSLRTEMTWCLPVDGDGDARRVTLQPPLLLMTFLPTMCSPSA